MRAAALAALVVWSQAANTAGFIYERRRASRGADAHGSRPSSDV
jgi:hypothetical protein